LSRRFIYYVVASLSGASALIFENLWFRSASLVLGSGAWSSSLVLSAFMAGIALGTIYGANTGGAVLGVLGCELVLLPRFI
jgi:hypothetical protein